MLRPRKRKNTPEFSHILAFPQGVEKQVEKAKSLVPRKYFPMSENISVFNIFTTKPVFSLRSDAHFLFGNAAANFSFRSVSLFPHFFTHFFLFHRASFQEFPQAHHTFVFFHKNKKFPLSLPPWKITGARRQKPWRLLAFSDFSNFSTHSKTITPKNR